MGQRHLPGLLHKLVRLVEGERYIQRAEAADTDQYLMEFASAEHHRQEEVRVL